MTDGSFAIKKKSLYCVVYHLTKSVFTLSDPNVADSPVASNTHHVHSFPMEKILRYLVYH